METGTDSAARSPRPIVGVMLDNVDEDYQRAIWAGLERGAREAGASVVNFLGGDLDPDDPRCRGRNDIFKLVSPESLDGLVVVSSMLATYIGNEKLDAYCQRFRPLPMVSLGFHLPSMPSLVATGQHGMRELVEHLFVRHGRRRFFFLAGTAQNADGLERERIFRETLRDLKLPLDERFVVRGDFRAEKARAAVREALAEGLRFDALVCANDEMAMAAMAELEKAGVRIPEDVSVTGFDDVLGAQRLALPLTTVRQPTYELSRRAMHVVLGLIRGQPADAIERYPTEVVIRRSCGCFSDAVRRAGEPAPERRGHVSPQDLVEAVIASLGTRMSGTALGAKGWECVEELVGALASEVVGGGAAGTFVSRMDSWLRSPFGREVGDDLWEDLLSTLRREASGRLARGEKAEALLHQARVLLKEATRQQHWRAHAVLARRTQTLQYVLENLMGSFDVPTLLDNMARELPRIGVRRCYLAVHASADRPYEDARLLLAYDERGRRDVGEGLHFPARKLVPPELLDRTERFNVLWQPLIFGEENVGFIGVEFDPLDDVSSLALGRQIRSALKASMMVQEIREKDRLLQNVDRMRNEFIANITHDFRSLVTIIMDSSWLAMRPEEGQNLEEVRELSGIVYEASLRLKVAIDRLLDLASMDEHGLVLRIRTLRPKRFLSDLAAFYRPVLSVSGIVLEEELPDAEVEDLYSDPDKVEQIMHNLISNAAKFVEPGKGRVRLALAVRDDEVQIRVVDDGEGIPPERLETIFVRYSAQRRPLRRGGSGIGLAFVKELATYLKGSIAAESQGSGKGATFTLTLRRGKGVFESVEPSGAKESEAATSETSAVRNQVRLLLESSLRGKMAQKTKPASA